MPKRILLVNKFYYPRGGDCVVTLNTERLLRDQGHEVAVFAMRYSENLPNDWEDYFASEVDFGSSFSGKLRAASRTFGWDSVKSSFQRTLVDFKPDVVHLHNIHSYISPIVARLAKRHGCRVVWTLHDYKLLCPAYACMRDGEPCELCYGSKWGVVKHRCMKGSLAGSVIALLEAWKWSRKTLQRDVDVFICPSRFIASKMEQGGFDRNKLVIINNFLDPEKMASFADASTQHHEAYYCYVGRLSSEKGIETLLASASGLPHRLKVAGDGPLAESLREQYADCRQIEFLGRVGAREVGELLSHATLSVMPSQCYDNNPLGVIESLCAGTPVVGADMGGIPELIEDGKTGLIFRSGDPTALASAIDNAFAASWNNEAIKRQALETFSAQTHYIKLCEVYGI